MKSRAARPVVRFVTACLSACGGSPQAPAAAPSPAASAASADAPVPPPVTTTITRPPWASQYPATRVVEQKDTIFGTEVRDPYRWLEDAKSPEVQAWMKAQNDLTRAKLGALPGRDAIAARLKELVYVDTKDTPASRGGRLFYSRRSGAQEKSVVYYRTGKTGAEHVLLDPNTWSSDGSSSLHGWTVSWDGKHVAYNKSEKNSDETTMYVMEVSTGKVSATDVIPGTKYGAASWTPKGDGFYYVRLPVDPAIPEDARPGYCELRFHELGTDPAKDTLVREKTGDATKFVNGWLSKNGHWLFSTVEHGWSSNDVYFRDARKPGKTWTPIAEGKDALYTVLSFGDRFYVQTNEGAPKGRIFSVDPAHPERSAWKEIVPERADATLEGADIIGGALALTYLKDVTSRLELHDLDGKLTREIALPALGTASFAGEDDQDDAYYSFETYNYPPEIHSLSVRGAIDGKKESDSIWFKLKVPVDPAAYVVEQTFFRSKDGTQVPMFVVHAKTTARDGTAPLLLNGYGGFNSSETPTFRKSVFPWLERGGVYVVANIRGGAEYGEDWHRAGMKHVKQNVFDDFVGAAEALIKEKLTSGDRLVIDGASNGGLLMGAALTQRPDLFRVVLCGVPLLDMVRYHLFGSGRTWISEYGSADDEADFRTLLAYSPYHHVTPGTRYPSVLFYSADSDDRVDPLHARKMSAALQAASTGGPVLLRIEKNSGHGGADLVRSWVESYADKYAFALSEIAKTGGSMEPQAAP